MCPRRPLVCVRIQQQYRRQNGPRNARFSSKAIKRKSIKVMWTVQRYWQTRVKQHSRCLQSVNWSSAGENSNLTELLSLCVCWKENSSWVKVFFYWPHSLSVWLSANVCIHILNEAETWRKKLLFQPEQTGPGIKVGAWTSLMFQISYLWVIFAYNCFSKYCCSFTPALLYLCILLFSATFLTALQLQPSISIHFQVRLNSGLLFHLGRRLFCN